MSMRQCGRFLIVAAIVALLPLTSASIVSAHAAYKSSDPPANGTVQKAPAQVAITFSEETDPLKSGGSVTDASGATVSTGFKVDLNQRTNMTIDLKPNLPNGAYTVKWNTFTDDDNGMANGTFTFTIQAAAGAGTATTGTAPAVGSSAAAPPAATTASAATTTATVAATLAPTATRPATTSVATGTGGSATATTVPAPLPNTGNSGSGNGTPWAIAMLVVALLIIAGGLAYRLRLVRR
jgi:methionine-rich copper-binding protein CopC